MSAAAAATHFGAPQQHAMKAPIGRNEQETTHERHGRAADQPDLDRGARASLGLRARRHDGTRHRRAGDAELGPNGTERLHAYPQEIVELG
jgi:hypothetical protein